MNERGEARTLAERAYRDWLGEWQCLAMDHGAFIRGLEVFCAGYEAATLHEAASAD